jgi:hypothetical protein
MNAIIVFPWGNFHRHFPKDISAAEAKIFIDRCFSNYKHISLKEGRDERNFAGIKLQNACGFVHYESVNTSHFAWIKTKSIFGTILKAYTTAGNLVYQLRRLLFKGTNDLIRLQQILSQLLHGNFTMYLQLLVMSVGIKCCLETTQKCPLELALHRFEWIRVAGRIEEICNVVMFYIVDWTMMENYFHMSPWDSKPKSCTISVTRRGTMTLRLTWDKLQWTRTAPFYTLLQTLADFVSNFV